MKETRRQRLEQTLMEELSVFLSRELKDPRVPLLTLTRIALVDDGSHAVVYFLPLGELIESSDPKRIEKIREGLSSATGFIRKHLASRLHVRIVPTLDFQMDKGMENALRVQELLKKI